MKEFQNSINRHIINNDQIIPKIYKKIFYQAIVNFQQDNFEDYLQFIEKTYFEKQVESHWKDGK